MKIIAFLTASVLLLVSLIAIACDDDIESLLPKENLPEGWQLNEDSTEYIGDALFRHINGGAELYHDYGFVKLLVQDYINDEMEVRIEVYDMGSEKGAAGIFAENTKGFETTKEFGKATSIDPYQIIFIRGQYYFSLTNYNGSDAELEAMKKFSALVVELAK